MKRCALCLALWALVASAGCGPEQKRPGPGYYGAGTGAAKPIAPFRPAGAAGKKGDGAYLLYLQLRLISIKVPVGKASGSEDLWSYLDEEGLGATSSTCLGRNGLRVGVGRRQSWPDLAAILKRLTGRAIRTTTMSALPGENVHVVLKEFRPSQTIFFFHPDRTLSGADHPPGDNVLTLTCTVGGDDPSRILMTAVPQVRSSKRRTKIVKSPAGVMMVDKPTWSSFRPLMFQVSVPSKDFLVVGPSAESRRASSVGHHFLVEKKEGMEVETLLVIIPEVLAKPL